MASCENPFVNRCIDDKSMDHIDHALGRPLFPLRETSRNYFATSSRSQLLREFDASPYWVFNGISGKMAYYSVSDAGRKALSEYISKIKDRHRPFVVSFEGYSRIIPERTRAKAKYAYYLIVSDTWSDLTFSEFAKSATARRAA